ncbi:MAG: Fe-S-containing protein [Deltaproteobacteria bacterium]|nr:Fe-S-containing protein [Deltaproteobacteria bacterium]
MSRHTIVRIFIGVSITIIASVSALEHIYAGEVTNRIPMFELQASFKDGKIAIPLQTLKEKKLVRFIYSEKGKDLPLLGYISPSGKIVTAVSICEPCRSTYFFISGRRLVCKTCNTQWDLETLKGISGACKEYPPVQLKNSLLGNEVQIDRADVSGWTPRRVRR